MGKNLDIANNRKEYILWLKNWSKRVEEPTMTMNHKTISSDPARDSHPHPPVDFFRILLLRERPDTISASPPSESRKKIAYLYTQDHLHRRPLLRWNHLMVLVEGDYRKRRDQRGCVGIKEAGLTLRRILVHMSLLKRTTSQLKNPPFPSWNIPPVYPRPYSSRSPPDKPRAQQASPSSSD